VLRANVEVVQRVMRRFAEEDLEAALEDIRASAAGLGARCFPRRAWADRPERRQARL